MEESRKTHHAADAIIDLIGGMAGRSLQTFPKITKLFSCNSRPGPTFSAENGVTYIFNRSFHKFKSTKISQIYFVKSSLSTIFWNQNVQKHTYMNCS